MMSKNEIATHAYLNLHTGKLLNSEDFHKKALDTYQWKRVIVSEQTTELMVSLLPEGEFWQLYGDPDRGRAYDQYRDYRSLGKQAFQQLNPLMIIYDKVAIPETMRDEVYANLLISKMNNQEFNEVIQDVQT